MCISSKHLALASALIAAVALSIPASAQTAGEPRQKKPANTQATVQKPSRSPSSYRHTDKFPAGPLYNGTDWLGDDPDPFIRLQIQRDLSHRYGGDD